MKPARRRKMVDGGHPSLSIVRQCALVGVSRSSLYYPPQRASEEELSLMAEIDRQYLQTPFYRVPADEGLAGAAGYTVEPEAGAASYAGHWGASHLRRSRTSQPAPGVRVYPHLLGQAEITRPNCKRRH